MNALGIEGTANKIINKDDLKKSSTDPKVKSFIPNQSKWWLMYSRDQYFLYSTNEFPSIIDTSITLTHYADDRNILFPRENYLVLENYSIDTVSAINTLMVWGNTLFSYS